MRRTIARYHAYYKRKGFYVFLRDVGIKFGIFMAVIILGLLAFEHYTPGIAYYFETYSAIVPNSIILTFFFLSETILGLIPPDLFIVWAKQFVSPYAIVGLLGLLSYGGGLLAYYFGVKLLSFRKLNDYINIKFSKQFNMLRSWGGLIIIIAALLPLPFSTMCLGAGMLKYPFRILMVLGVFRIARFFIYASVLYRIV